MAALPLLPALLDLTAETEDDIDAENDLVVVQGQTYVLQVQILDEQNDPFDLGPTVAPEWSLAGQLRGNVLDVDSSVDAQFTASVTDGPNGWIELSLTPTQTAALVIVPYPEPRWDCFITNKTVGGNSNYAAGFSQMIFRGKWSLLQRVTEA
jgi:hypothetical protein